MIAKLASKAAIGATLACAGSAVAADAQSLPTSGHFIGYATVVSPSRPCLEKAGDHFTFQLELNTVKDVPVFLTRHVDYPAAAGVPVLYKTAFDRKSGGKLAPKGTITLTDENTGKSVAGTYSAIYTPFDLNSFGATVHLSYPIGSGMCTITRQAVFVRSSAD